MEKIRTCTKHYLKHKVGEFCPKCAPNINLYQDEAYINSRNALIPEAEQRAHRAMNARKNKTENRNGADGRLYNHCFFTELFCAAMTNLVEKYNIRNQ